MPLYSFEGRSPTIDPTAFVAPTAASIGDVHVEAGASVWFNAVIRADFLPPSSSERVFCRTAVCCTPLRAYPSTSDRAPRSHGCVIHGVHIGPQAVIANHATVLDGAVIGARSSSPRTSLWWAARRSPMRSCGPGRRRRSGTGSPVRVRRRGSTPTCRRVPDLARRYLSGLAEVPKTRTGLAVAILRGPSPDTRAVHQLALVVHLVVNTPGAVI